MHLTPRSTLLTRLRRLVSAAVLVAAGLAGGLAPAPAQAQAASTVDLTCNSTYQFEFDHASFAHARVVGMVGFCTSPDGRSPNLSAGTITGRGTANACPQTIITGTLTTTWLTADLRAATSIATFTVNLSAGTAMSKVSRGPLKGDTVTASPAAAATTPVTCPNGQIGLKRLAVTSSTATFSH